MRVVFLPSFRRDLRAITREIGRENPDAARRFAVRARDRCRILTQYPEAGPLRPEIMPGCRHLTVPPYLVLYRVRSEHVEIVRFIHMSRDLRPDLFDV